MTREQYKRSSKVAYPGVMLTCAVVLLTLVGAVAFQVSQSYVSIIIQIIGIIISMILATVSYLLKKEEKIGMIGIAGAGAVMYLLVSFVNRNEYVFLYGFIILFLSMTYLNRRLIVWGNCFIIVGFIVHCIKIQMLHGVAADWVALGAVTIVLCCVASITVISLLLKYNEENVSAISKKAEEQEKTAKALMEIAEQITESFDKASAVLISLNEAVEANDEAMQNIADSTTGTAESVQAQAEMCLEIQKETDMAGQGIERMMNASDKTKVMVGEGAELILELKEQAHVVEDTNKSTVEATQRLALKVENVKEIIGAILSISSQTNLLALNASIEAARAGEAGRGFAVVAEQIRTLSENTRESANQITNIIEELIADVTVTNGSVDVSSATIEKQSEMIDEAKKKFDLIEEEVSELVANINATEGVMKQILKATGVISDNISHLSANSEEVAATSEEGTKIAKRGVEDIRLVDNEMAHIYKLAEQLKRV